MSTVIYKVLCLSDVFIYVDYDYKDDKWHEYVIGKWQNDSVELKEYIDKLKIMIGYGNENKDYPLLHCFLECYNEYSITSSNQIVQMIYTKLRHMEENEYNYISDKEKRVYQIDLCMMLGYNKKHYTLDDIKFALHSKSIQQMPSNKIECKEDMKLFIQYCHDDIETIYALYKTIRGDTNNLVYKDKDKISLRLAFKNWFGLDCLNYSDIRIGEQLMLNMYCNKTGKNKYDLLKSGGTKRHQMCLKECIPSWTVFKSKAFNDLKEKYQNTCIDTVKEKENTSIVFNGMQINYGTSGARSSGKSGIYVSDNEYIIISLDVQSEYPCIAIQNGYYPEHLGKDFVDVYKEIVSMRLIEKNKTEERNDVAIEALKYICNSIFGKSMEEKSFLYDPLYMLKVVITGQMFMSLFIERLTEAINDIQFLFCNTDGMVVRIPFSKWSSLKQVVCDMTELTGLQIEQEEYTKLVMCDMNNYIACLSDGTVKTKGKFEIDKELHKNQSMRIVPIALVGYFLNGIPIRDAICDHKDIFDFCIKFRTEPKTVSTYKTLKDTIPLGDVTRYYISNKGGQLYKEYGVAKSLCINAGYYANLFNEYEEKVDYDINYNYYIIEANKVKDCIKNPQLDLFNK